MFGKSKATREVVRMEAAARHEAAHAMVALALGFNISRINVIEAKGHHHGITEVEDIHLVPARDLLPVMAIALAPELVDHSANGCFGDRVMADRFAADMYRVTGTAKVVLLDGARELARNTLAHHKDDYNTLVKFLMSVGSSREIYPEDLAALFTA